MEDLKKISLSDMASATKAIGEYSGKTNENPHEWIESAETIGKLIGMDDRNMIRDVILNLRGRAKSWRITFVREKGLLDWKCFKNEFTNRFTNQGLIDEVVNRFLATRESESYDDYVRLLDDARMIKVAKGMGDTYIMRQVTARVPSGIKALLLQEAQRGSTWKMFLKTAEDAA